MLELDNAGWHSEPGLAVPEGIRLVYMPAYTPELQPAETLWPLVDEPIVNKHIAAIEELEQTIARRCTDLAGLPDQIRSRTRFHWWPEIKMPN